MTPFAIMGTPAGLMRFSNLKECRVLSSSELDQLDLASEANPVTFCAGYEPLRAYALGKPVTELVDVCVWDSMQPVEPEPAAPAKLSWSLEWNEHEFAERLTRVVEYLRAGDCYQINLTLRGRAATDLSADALFWQLYARQPVPYAALMPFNNAMVVSLSPELMWQQSGRQIRCQPMKGTLARSLDPVQDAANKAWLAADLKNQAENLMILDLLRNDLGRIAKTGSVNVPQRFNVKSFETVHQMVSTVTAELADTSFAAKLRALAPYGSITGAPKVRAMEIIEELESSPRGIYTGMCGYQYRDESVANVAIRSGLLRDGLFEFGLGGGMTVDSQASDEWQEILTKGAFLGV